MNGWIGRKIPLLPGNSSLGQGNKNNIFQFKAKVTIKNLQKEPYGHQKKYKIKNKNIKTNTVGGPEGQGQKIRRLKAQPLLDPGPNDHMPSPIHTGEPTGQSDTLPEGWPPIAGQMAGVTLTGEPPEGGMLKFKQMNISAYFSSTKTIDFDREMRRLEKERLLELKRRKEMEWVERRKANQEKQELLMGQKKVRLNKAAMSTLSSRTQAWSLREDGDHQSPKRMRDSDWLTAASKRQKKDGGSVSRSLLLLSAPPMLSAGMSPSSMPDTLPDMLPDIPTSLNMVKSPVQAKIIHFENAKNVGGPKKAPKNSKVLNVRTKKWVKKKNGMFGWVSSVQARHFEKEPQISQGVGVQNEKINLQHSLKGKVGKTDQLTGENRGPGGKSCC